MTGRQTRIIAARTRAWRSLGGALAAVLILATPAILPAQQTGRQEQREEPVDSARLRVQQRLEALGRPPGLQPGDTIPDSTRVARGRAGGGAPGRPGGGAGASDTILAALRELQGYSAVSYEGSRADYDAESGELVLRASPEAPAALLQPTGETLTADSIIRYNQVLGTGEALGNPIATPPEGDPVAATRFVFDAGGERASAFGARTRYSQGGGTTWNVTGDLPLVSGDVMYGDHTRFTSCDLESPHYHFETEKLKIVRGSILVARPVKLYFADVPVAWLPFVAQSLSGGDRASGLLTPRFSVNDIVRTSGSYRRRISNLGFFWAMSDYSDATLAFDWFSDTYVALTGSVRYRWLRQFLNGSMNVRRYWSSSQSNQFALDTQNSWEISERSNMNMSVRYATSTSFVRQNSFDPREVTAQIRSQGGFSHRFDWGTLNLSADRAQSLSDDGVTMSLPRLGLSIRPITLLDAPANRASWYNNVTWTGGLNFSRRLNNRAAVPDTVPFSFSQLDVADMDGTVSSSFNVGRFSTSQSLAFRQGSLFDVPRDTLVFFPSLLAEKGLAGLYDFDGRRALGGAGLPSGPPVDISTTEMNWNVGFDYQQTLIGTTTFTPRLNFSGTSRRADTVAVAQSFVAAPTRVSFGAALKADIYGFWGGVGPYSGIRHKLTPSFTYDWSPGTEPSDLQSRVFGSQALQPQSVVSLNFNQTFEAKRRPVEAEADTTAGAEADTAAAEERPEDADVGVDDSVPDPGEEDQDGPRRIEQGEIVNLLAINTSVIRYDFVEADSTGDFLRGFRSTSLQNQISSDFLPGLTISMSHDLFRDREGEPGEEGGLPKREFAPHLTSMNFSFGLGPRSAIFRWIPFLGAGRDAEEATPEEEDETADEPYPQRSATDEMSVIPGQGTDLDREQDERDDEAGSGGLGDWNARFSYAMSRPRDPGPRGSSQLLRIGLNMSPTPQWDASWDTSYDMVTGEFADHRIRLTRDLHRWQANFDFLKTATGNWSFRFEVSLLDNRDLKFDYEQQNLQDFERRR